MGVPEIEAFLTDLAVNRQGAASTQNQVLSALLFLYNAVLQHISDERVSEIRARKLQRSPTVLTPESARSGIQDMSEGHRLIDHLIDRLIDQCCRLPAFALAIFSRCPRW